MQITNLPDPTLAKLIQDGMADRNHCYMNAARLVLNNHFGDAEYVLCWVTDSAGGVHGHAVVKAKGHYWDPTLQAASASVTNYMFVKMFTRSELIKFIEESCGPGSITTGFHPPALFPGGRIECVAITKS